MTTFSIKIRDRVEKIEVKDVSFCESDMNRIARTHTAASRFFDLINAEGGYRPSIYLGGKSKQAKSDLVRLTLHYDQVQRSRKDSRRVYCGDFEILPIA